MKKYLVGIVLAASLIGCDDKQGSSQDRSLEVNSAQAAAPKTNSTAKPPQGIQPECDVDHAANFPEFPKNPSLLGGESVTDPCAWETLTVKNAKKGLSPKMVYTYCLQDKKGRKPGSPGGAGLQCRSLTFFEDKQGNLSQDYFVNSFIASEHRRNQFHEIHFVKQADGKYSSFTDRITDNLFEIDRNKSIWRNQEVVWDENSGLPSYMALFSYTKNITDSNGNIIGEEEIIEPATLKFYEDVSELVVYKPGSQVDLETVPNGNPDVIVKKDYLILNPPQIKK